jgi:hypothetical protein
MLRIANRRGRAAGLDGANSAPQRIIFVGDTSGQTGALGTNWLECRAKSNLVVATQVDRRIEQKNGSRLAPLKQWTVLCQ